jgi:hypothetical protein
MKIKKWFLAPLVILFCLNMCLTVSASGQTKPKDLTVSTSHQAKSLASRLHQIPITLHLE